MTSKVIVRTSTIQAGQSINDNFLQIFIQTPLNYYSSEEQFIGRNRSNKSITHLLIIVSCPLNKVLNSDLEDRYNNRLQETRINALSNTNIDESIKLTWRNYIK